MVFLTAQLWLRNRVTDRYWRIQEVLKHARVSCSFLTPRRPVVLPPPSLLLAQPRTPLSRFLSQHFRGRKNRCYRLAVRAVTRAFVKCTKARKLKKRNLRTVSVCGGGAVRTRCHCRHPLPGLRRLHLTAAPTSCGSPKARFAPLQPRVPAVPASAALLPPRERVLTSYPWPHVGLCSL